MTMNLGNWNFYVCFLFLFLFFILGKWANVILGSEHETSPFLFFFFLIPSPICHPGSIFCPTSLPFSLCGTVSVPGPCGESSLHLSSMLSFSIFFVSISVYMAGDKMAAILFDRLHQFTLLPTLSGFSLSPSQAYSSSQYLPVLSKCYCKVFQWDDSKYVYINRGNTLGYILLNPCVASSLSTVSLTLHSMRYDPRRCAEYSLIIMMSGSFGIAGKKKITCILLQFICMSDKANTRFANRWILTPAKKKGQKTG